METLILNVVEKYITSHPEVIENLVAKYLPGIIEGLVELIVKAIASHLSKPAA